MASAPGKCMLSNAFHRVTFSAHNFILHGAGHITFVMHYTIVSNIIVLSSSWRSIVYRLAYFVLYVTIYYTGIVLDVYN